MNEITQEPSEHHSFHVNKGLGNNIADLNKKRKLQAEHLGLPIPKHRCGDRNFDSENVSVFDKNLELESLFTHIVTAKAEGATAGDESAPESAKDSNSFSGDSDSVTASYEVNFPLHYAKTYVFDNPSTSSANSDGSSSKRILHSPGSSKDKLVVLSEEHPPPSHDGFQSFPSLEEQLLQCCNQVENTCSEYGKDSLENHTDMELEDILYSNGPLNPNMYVLSSGRWSVNQDSQPGKRKPTIDQEFEQYFSGLML